jgi:hypothetical protein
VDPKGVTSQRAPTTKLTSAKVCSIIFRSGEDLVETSITAGPLLSLAVTVTSEQHIESVLRKIVEGLASQPGVALVRIWLLPSVHIPNAWQEGAHTQDGIEHLRLVASAGNPIRSPGEDWSFLQGRFSRFPLNIGNVGQVAADRHPIFIKDLTAQDNVGGSTGMGTA